ncbi:MAG: SMP-30/gluconolactonase/LRE family protein [Planctomycetia bacterium]|nr:SMP-30/gluconolactonase/LRE family protein [Planctomycetia bacterium]
MRRTEARVFIAPDKLADRYLLEGPRLRPAGSRSRVGPIAWVNIQRGPNAKGGTIYTKSWDTKHLTELPQPTRPGFVLPTEWVLELLVGREKELGIVTEFNNAWQPLATISDDNPRTIINDAEIVPGGKAIVFGTKDTQFKDRIAHLYLYTVDDNRVSVLVDKQTCSNGKVFASDARGLILFDIDTPTRKVVRYRLDVEARTATRDGVALDLSNEVGFPDGMCDCGDGSVIIAFYNPDFAEAGRAVRFKLATGKAVEEWVTPGSPRVTCPLLVKREGGVKLILTTATEGMPAEMFAECPNAGCLFIANTQLRDCPRPEVVRLPKV